MNSRASLITAVAGISTLALVGWHYASQPANQQTITAQASTTHNEQKQEFVERVENTTPSQQTLAPYYELAPELESIGNEFALYKGIKDVLDNLIVSADSTDKATILVLAKGWCAKQELSASGCQAFEALFGRYIDYKLALASHESAESRPQDSLAQIQHRLQALNDLRYQWFSAEEIAALFSDDQQLNEQALARRQIAMDKDLSRDEKIQLIAEHLEQLPDEQRAPLEPTLQMHSLEQIKTEYADKQLRLMEVETKFGYEAAKRLEKTWQKQEAFQSKIDDIAQQYQSLNAEDATALKAQQIAFLQQHFEGNELRRAKAILKSY